MKSYRAFISYSHRDKRWGEWLHRKLETYRVPTKIVGRETDYGPIPRRLTPIFRDRDELAAADDLGAEIKAALSASMFLIVICSPEAAKSRWVNEEIKAFKKMHGEARVRAVIVGGVPFSGDAKTECFPEALRFKVGADGALSDERAEPIAADLRPGGDGKKYAISKLVAGLTGATLDEIIQRENQRRNARLRVAIAGVSSLAIAFAGIAWEALKQRDNARVAQSEAESQREQAVAARDDAEDLVEFMLTDLRSRLDAVGRLDVLDSVGKRALAYYDGRDLSTAGPDALGRRARAQLLIGEMDNQRGDLDAALAAYEAAAVTTEEQLRRDPQNAQRIFDHSQSVFWVGYIAWQRGDAETARQYFLQYQDQAKRLVEIDPDNADYQLEYMYSLSNLGTLELEQGNAAKAESYFQVALEISLRFQEQEPENIDLLIEAGQSHAWLADALHLQLKFGGARTERAKEIDYYDTALALSENHARVSKQKIVAQKEIASLNLATGDLQGAIDVAQVAAMRADELHAGDPGNTEWLELGAASHAVHAEALFHSGAFDTARDFATLALSKGQLLIVRNDSVAIWKGKYLAEPLIILSRVEAAVGNTALSTGHIVTAHDHLQELIDQGSSTRVMLRRFCHAKLLRGRITDERDAAAQEIIGHLDVHRESGDARLLTVLVEAYHRTDQIAEAQEISLRLINSNYRHPDFLALLTLHPVLGEALNGEGK